ncbi:MAG TPA: DUF3247 family protein [Frateuria sp.]|uniref:DUF3247 family protein n=1 Tax=Frateuria sp. TaxID=2211372 RepID=UPI002DEEAE98|nr:DUF3247 family protein [Frateuria sp.]
MGRQAEHIYTDQPTIARFNGLVEHLQNGARVRLYLVDGSTCEGVVAARPTVQEYYDGDGNEGSNGVAHLERPGISQWKRYVWFDQIVRIEHLDADAPSWS